MLVALCLRQQLQWQRGMEGGEGSCIDGKKEREKRGGKGERSSLQIGITNLFSIVQASLFAVVF